MAEESNDGFHKWGPWFVPIIVSIVIAFISAISYYYGQLDDIHIKLAEVTTRETIVFERLNKIEISIRELESDGLKFSTHIASIETELQNMKEEISIIKIDSREILNMLMLHESNERKAEKNITKFKLKEK